jgi:hypothetical protein
MDCDVAKRDVVVSGGDLLIERRNPGEPAVRLLEGLSLGGERNYGFGRIRRSVVPPGIQSKIEQYWPSNPDDSHPVSGPLLSHMTYDPCISFRGSIEILAAREYAPRRQHSYTAPGRAIENAGYWFAPGTAVLTKISASLDAFGRLRLVP